MKRAIRFVCPHGTSKGRMAFSPSCCTMKQYGESGVPTLRHRRARASGQGPGQQRERYRKRARLRVVTRTVRRPDDENFLIVLSRRS